MDELAKSLQKKYIEDITSKYPFHRFISVFFYLIAIHAYYVKDNPRLIGYLSEIKTSFLFDFKSGLLSELSLLNTISAILLAIATSFLSNKLRDSAFTIFKKVKNFDLYIERLQSSISYSTPNNQAVTWSISSDIAKQLEVKRTLLRSKHASAELALTCTACIVLGYKNLEWIDVWIMLIFGFIFLRLHFKAFLLYIAEFLPTYVAEQTLLGKEVKFGDGKDTG